MSEKPVTFYLEFEAKVDEHGYLKFVQPPNDTIDKIKFEPVSTTSVKVYSPKKTGSKILNIKKK